jgi:hypothetical protein
MRVVETVATAASVLFSFSILCGCASDRNSFVRSQGLSAPVADARVNPASPNR